MKNIKDLTDLNSTDVLQNNTSSEAMNWCGVGRGILVSMGQVSFSIRMLGYLNFWLWYVVFDLSSYSVLVCIRWFWKTSIQASPTWPGLTWSGLHMAGVSHVTHIHMLHTWPGLHMSPTYWGHRLNLFYSCLISGYLDSK